MCHTRRATHNQQRTQLQRHRGPRRQVSRTTRTEEMVVVNTAVFTMIFFIFLVTVYVNFVVLRVELSGVSDG